MHQSVLDRYEESWVARPRQERRTARARYHALIGSIIGSIVQSVVVPLMMVAIFASAATLLATGVGSLPADLRLKGTVLLNLIDLFLGPCLVPKPLLLRLWFS